MALYFELLFGCGVIKVVSSAAMGKIKRSMDLVDEVVGSSKKITEREHQVKSLVKLQLISSSTIVAL